MMAKRLKANISGVLCPITDTALFIFENVLIIQWIILDFLPFDADNHRAFQEFANNKYFLTRLNIAQQDALQIFQKHKANPVEGYDFACLIYLFSSIKALFGDAFYSMFLDLSWLTGETGDCVFMTKFGKLQVDCHPQLSLHLCPPRSILNAFDSETQVFIRNHSVLRNHFDQVTHLAFAGRHKWHINDKMCVQIEDHHKIALDVIELDAGTIFKTSTLPIGIRSLRLFCGSSSNLILDHSLFSHLTQIWIDCRDYGRQCNITCSITGSQLSNICILNRHVTVHWDIFQQFPVSFSKQEMEMIRKEKSEPTLSFTALKQKKSFQEFCLDHGQIDFRFLQDIYVFRLDIAEQCFDFSKFILQPFSLGARFWDV